MRYDRGFAITFSLAFVGKKYLIFNTTWGHPILAAVVVR